MNNEPLRGCIFDLDGTIMDSLEDLAACCNQALIDYGYDVHTLEEYRVMAGEGTTLLCERALPPYADTPELLSEIKQRFDDYYSQRIENTRPFPAINGMLRQLRALRTSMAIICGRNVDIVRPLIRRTFGDGLFDAIIMRRPDMPYKPNPQILLEAADALGCRPDECAYIGDTGTDMSTAVAAEMRGVGVLWGYGGADELLEHGALAIVRTPSELPPLIRRWQLDVN